MSFKAAHGNSGIFKGCHGLFSGVSGKELPLKLPETVTVISEGFNGIQGISGIKMGVP